MKTSHTGNGSRTSKRDKRKLEKERVEKKFGRDSQQLRHLMASLPYRFFT